MSDRILIRSVTASLPHQLPVINLQSLLSGDVDEFEKLHFASNDWGFFQLINHGVDDSLVEKVKLDIQEFFKLLLEEKKKLRKDAGDVEGYGQAFVLSEEQKLDWLNICYMELPTHLRNAHLFPKLPLPLRDSMEEYSVALKAVGVKILGLMVKAEKMMDEDMRELSEEGTRAMRTNPRPQQEPVVDLAAPSDEVRLTFLLQLNELEGLQIKRDGMWFPVKPLPSAFIVNTGAMLESKHADTVAFSTVLEDGGCTFRCAIVLRG